MLCTCCSAFNVHVQPLKALYTTRCTSPLAGTICYPPCNLKIAFIHMDFRNSTLTVLLARDNIFPKSKLSVVAAHKSKNCTAIHSFITFTNIGRFLLFHNHNLHEICSKIRATLPTTPWRCHYTI